MLVELRSPDGATPDKSPEWKPRWRGDSGPFVFWTEPEALIQRVVKRPSLSYRAHYNLACFYADQQPDEALQELRLTLAELRGHRRDRTAALAWADPSLASLHQLEQFAAIVGPEPARVRVDQAELGGIAVIGTDAAKLLSQERIRSAEDLLELSERPTELAKALGIGPELLQLWRCADSLGPVRGKGDNDANLLLAEGISSSSDLAQRNPQRVLSLLSDVNRFQHVVERLPSLSEITAWIEEAHR